MKKILTALLCAMPTAALANPACPVCTIAIGAVLPIVILAVASWILTIC